MHSTARNLVVPDTLTPRNFSRLADFIQGYSGIKMPPEKRTMLDGRLRKRMRSLGIQDINDYCHYLFEEDGLETEAVDLIDSVTTNKTDFFREPEHFQFLEKTGLPALARLGRRQIKAWSSACSTGAESYTLAMVLEDFCATRQGMDYQILSTDLCTEVLKQALAGVYDSATIDPVPTPYRKRYMLQARDPRRDAVRIHPSIRSKMSFARLNIMDPAYPVDRDMDLLFCRNMLIYFEKSVQAKVLRKLCDHIRPGGYLFLGHSESIAGIDLPVDQVANTVFQRR